MKPDDNTYRDIYEGNYYDRKAGCTVSDPAYWRDANSYYFTRTNKLAPDKPTVVIGFTLDKIMPNTEGESILKRLKHYLLNLEQNNNSYHDIYNGQMYTRATVPPTLYSDNTYWDGDIGYTISKTNKHELDKPTVTVNIPVEKINMQDLTTAAADYILRAFIPYIDELNEANYNRSRPDKENGKYYIYKPDGKVFVRNTACFAPVDQRYYEYIGGTSDHDYGYQISLPDYLDISPKLCVNLMIQVQLPYKKHRKAIQMLTKDLPSAVERFILDFDSAGLEKTLLLAEKQAQIRAWLKSSPYCAFIANGSILPRSKGTDLPLENAVSFRSVPEDEIQVCGVRGMGIKKGVTVITGGGYSGKSTLLDALSAGIYNHIPSDGRELVITDDTALKISAEDGRSVKNVNISPFIKWIPGGNPSDFSTEHASGSTSQAANIMEAVNYGSKLLLIDEDKSATNFMIRDNMMKELIEKEPITPYTDRVNELYAQNDVSTILVIGGSGEYLAVSDKIYRMQDYLIDDVTVQARRICGKVGAVRDLPPRTEWNYQRTLLREGFSSYPPDSGTEVLEISDMGFIFMGDERIDIRMLHNIASAPQLNAAGFILRHLALSAGEYKIDIGAALDSLYEKIARDGLDSMFSSFFTGCGRWLDLPRKYEVLAIINRMRGIRFIQNCK